MGRKTTSTKGGKFMNPTDQARKEARRRELKKNKRQRMAVRQAVIKTKDPHQMVKELDELDEMELNPTIEPAYNDKVIKEKRRKLLGSLVRIVQFYCKEDPPKGRQFKILLEEYRFRRHQKESFCESVKNAETVELGAIPLPDKPFATPNLSEIPLPGSMPQSILKKSFGPAVGFPASNIRHSNAPGHPPGHPPAKKVFISRDAPEFHKLASTTSVDKKKELKDSFENNQGLRPEDVEEVLSEDEDEFRHRDDHDDFDDDQVGGSSKLSKGVHFADEEDDSPLSSDVTPLQAMMLKMAGQKIPSVLGGPHNDDGGAETSLRQLEPPGPPPGLPPGPPPGMPPMMKSSSGILPPGPPPGIPPGPPSGLSTSSLPPSMLNLSEAALQQSSSVMKINSNVFSAPPNLINRPSALNEMDDKLASSAATISAKPQLTGLPRGEATRFLPTTLRVKREVKQARNPVRYQPLVSRSLTSGIIGPQKGSLNSNDKSNADEAYDSFMKEMKGLL